MSLELHCGQPFTDANVRRSQGTLRYKGHGRGEADSGPSKSHPNGREGSAPWTPEVLAPKAILHRPQLLTSDTIARISTPRLFWTDTSIHVYTANLGFPPCLTRPWGGHHTLVTTQAPKRAVHRLVQRTSGSGRLDGRWVLRCVTWQTFCSCQTQVRDPNTKRRVFAQ